MILVAPGTDIDSIARQMFKGGPYQNLPLSTKRAVLIHNNPELVQFLDSNRVPCRMALEITPLRLTRFDKAHWQSERPMYLSYLRQLEPLTRDMLQEAGPQDTYVLARIVQSLREAGASVGMADVVRGTGYAAGGVSSLAAAGEMSTARILALSRTIFDDAAHHFGRKAAASMTKANLALMADFIKAHPGYPELMRQLEKIPDFLLPMSRSRLVPPAGAGKDATLLARHFGKQYFQAFRHWNSGRYMGTIARATQRPHQHVPGAGTPRHLVCPGRYRTLQRLRSTAGSENAYVVRGGVWFNRWVLRPIIRGHDYHLMRCRSFCSLRYMSWTLWNLSITISICATMWRSRSEIWWAKNLAAVLMIME